MRWHYQPSRHHRNRNTEITRHILSQGKPADAEFVILVTDLFGLTNIRDRDPNIRHLRTAGRVRQ